MKFNPSKPRPYARRGVVEPGRWEIDLRGVLDNGIVVARERRVFPVNPSVGKIGKRQAVALAAEEWERWNRRGQVLRPGEKVPLPQTGGMKPGHAPTFSQFADDYLDYCKSPSAGPSGANRDATVELKEGVMRLHLGPAFGSMRMDQLHQRDIDRYVVQKSKLNRSPRSIQMDLICLHRMLVVAESQGLIDRLPKFKMPGCPPSTVEALDPEETQRFVKAIPKHYRGWRGIMMELYLKTGLRSGEALALFPADLRLDAAHPTVRVERTYRRGKYGPTKGGRPRVVPLVPSLAAAMDRELAEQGLSPRSTTHHLFTAEPRGDKPLSCRYVLRCVRKIGDAAETRPLTVHMLRHTFGTDCARRGIPPLTIKEWMGHADLETTMQYVHLFAPDHLRWAHMLGE